MEHYRDVNVCVLFKNNMSGFQFEAIAIPCVRKIHFDLMELEVHAIPCMIAEL